MGESTEEGATTPLPGIIPAEGGTTGEASAAPLYAPVPAAGSVPHASHAVPRWVVVTAAVLGAVFVLAVTFGMGVAVGSHASRFNRGPEGLMMQAPGGWRGEQGWQNDRSMPRARGERGRGSADPGYGGRMRGFPGGQPSCGATTTP